jgi:hypothetical protein
MFTTDHQTDIPSLPIQPVSHLRPLTDPTGRDIVQGYTKLVTDRVDEGWTCYLVTFLFSQFPGPRSAVIGQMRDEAQRVATLLRSAMNSRRLM